MAPPPPVPSTPDPGTTAPRPPRRPAVQAALSRVWPHILLAGGCALAITLLVTSYLQTSLGFSALDAVRQQSERIDHLDRLQFLLVDAETGVRGFLLTGQPIYLEPYEQAATTLPQVTRQVLADFADLPAERGQLEALVALVEGKQKLLAEAVAQRTLGETPVDQMRGKLVMDEVRSQITKLRAALVTDGRQGIDQSLTRFRLAQIIGIVLAAGSLVLLVVLFAVLQRQFEMRERLAALLAGENARLDEQVRRRTAELSELARYLTQAREAEKARLARELHDELGGLLTVAKLDAGWISRKLPAETKTLMQERLDRLQSALTQGIALKRRIIDDLQPPLLKELGLVEALRALAESVDTGQELEVVCELPEDLPEPDPERALALYRIAQEAFTNVLKYARARKIRLALSQAQGWIHLEVADDGCGFDPEHLAADRHGIAGMKHRVQTYAGRLSIRSAPGQGSQVRASLPLA